MSPYITASFDNPGEVGYLITVVPGEFMLLTSLPDMSLVRRQRILHYCSTDTLQSEGVLIVSGRG
jgi:hypothetical protein